MTKSREQRTNRRVVAKRPARVRLNDAVEELQGQTRDVSLRGVFVYLSRNVCAGSTLEIVLPMPEGLNENGEQWVRCRCRVVRVEPGPQEREFGVAATIESFEPLADAATAHA